MQKPKNSRKSKVKSPNTSNSKIAVNWLMSDESDETFDRFSEETAIFLKTEGWAADGWKPFWAISAPTTAFSTSRMTKGLPPEESQPCW